MTRWWRAAAAAPLLLLPLVGQQAPAAANPPERHVMLTLREQDAQGKVSTRTYTLSLGPMPSSDNVRVGGRVPVRGTDAAGKDTITYMDTGLAIDVSGDKWSAETPDEITLRVTIDITTLAPGSTPGLPIFRRVSSHVEPHLRLGLSEQIADFADPDSDARYTLTALVVRDAATATASAGH